MKKRILLKRLFRWTVRGTALTVCFLFAAVLFMTIADVQEEEKKRQEMVVAAPLKNEWCRRASPDLPEITIDSGAGPVDHGVFENCRILEHGGGNGVSQYLVVTQLSDDQAFNFEAKYEINSGGKHPTKFHLKLKDQPFIFTWLFPSSAKTVRGTLLYLASIEVFTKRENDVLQVARDAGWNILVMTVDMSFSASQEVTFDEDGERRLAARIDNHLTERAVAMAGMLKFLEERKPSFVQDRRILIGLSAGAIALPSVAARIGQIDAAVLIGSGENVAEIMLRSPLFRHHTSLVRKRKNADGEWQTIPVTDPRERIEFAQRVFKRCKIDPARTASSLAQTPVLMLQAKYDRIVPASTGDALYQSLGKPERWSYRTGHIGLCIMLPWKIGRVLDWIERQQV